MKKIAIVIIAAILGIFVISGISMYFSYNNQEISLRNEAEAHQRDRQGRDLFLRGRTGAGSAGH